MTVLITNCHALENPKAPKKIFDHKTGDVYLRDMLIAPLELFTERQKRAIIRRYDALYPDIENAEPKEDGK